MARRSRHPVRFEEPVDDLKELGVRFQQQLAMTVDRLHGIKSPDLLRRTLRVVDDAQHMFNTVSQTAQLTDRLLLFMERNLGYSVDDLFALTGTGEHMSRVFARQGITLVNEGIARCMDQLANVNREIDKEQEYGDEKKT